MQDSFDTLWRSRFNEEIKHKLSEIVIMGYSLTDEIFNNNEILKHPLSYNAKPHLRRDIIDILLEGLQIGFPGSISSETAYNTSKNFRYSKVSLRPFLLTQHHVRSYKDNPRFAYFRDRFIVSKKQLKMKFIETPFPFLNFNEHIYVQLIHGSTESISRRNHKNGQPTKPSFMMLGVPEKNNKGWWHEEPLEIIDISTKEEDIKDYATPIINLLKKKQSETNND